MMMDFIIEQLPIHRIYEKDRGIWERKLPVNGRDEGMG